MSISITFLGGAETVTGSKFLLQTDSTQILIDCGLFQGYKWLRERNWQPLPISLDIEKLDAVLLTHAHLDHSGYIPALYKQGYRGPIYTHAATVELCSILLPDSGHIQEEDARYYKKHKLSKHQPPQPLYDKALAESALHLFRPIAFNQVLRIGDVEVEFFSAGHILGAAFIVVKVAGKTIGFSGDVGRENDVLMYPPANLPPLDHLILESTYGNRLHEENDSFAELADIVTATAEKGGVLMIPSFSVGRAQLLQFMLAQMMDDGRLPHLPIFLDSPMAIDVSDIYCEYHEHHRLQPEQCQLMSRYVTFTRSVDESKALAAQQYPHIIIAGSGMATGGRILHHMQRLLPQHNNCLLLSGFQAGGTRGAKIMGGAENVRIHGNWLSVRASVENLSGLSGHADYRDLREWLKRSGLAAGTQIHLVHGEPEALETFRDYLLLNTDYAVRVAPYRSILRL